CDILSDPIAGHPFCVPRSRTTATSPRLSQVNGRAMGRGIDVRQLRAGYGRAVILPDLSVTLPAGAVTAIVGPNACGKSTLLRTIGRLIKPSSGGITLDGQSVHRGSRRALARRMAMLTQGPVPPAGFLVEDLVSAGRFPHQSLFRQWTTADEAAIEAAIIRCGLGELRYRELETLSGGQGQRAWIAMALAQDTPVLLLDEPTTFLDLAHQIELLDLVRELNQQEGRSVVMILHDLNLAARYAHTLVAMKDGHVVAAGAPDEVLTEALLRDVFEIEASIMRDPQTGDPLVLPNGTSRGAPELVMEGAGVSR
ncbi:MAG: ABC transporter ATP-binding protein, partial [Dehalococcoidia bacterium]